MEKILYIDGIKMIHKFNPSLISREDLEKIVVGRDVIVDRLMKKIERCLNESITHTIIIGQRGMGKTTILLLLYYEVKEKFKEVIPVMFPEEEYSIYSLADLFLELLGKFYKETNFYEVGNVIEKIKNLDDEDSIVDYSLEFLRNFSKENGKIFLLLIDNIHIIFQQMDEKELGRLREILMKDNMFIIIGSAPSMFDEIINYDKSFYNFFEIENLKELTLEECKEMIKKVAKINGHKEISENIDNYIPKISAILHLSGGNPRIILMFYEIMSKSGVSEVEEQLKKLLDELTPYYQSRLGTLPPQERKIFDALALTDCATPTEISKNVRIGNVGPPIKNLLDKGYVKISKQKRRKIVLYEISEPLFGIWREMRMHGREKPKFLMKFLEIWFSPDNLEILLSDLKSYEEAEKEYREAIRRVNILITQKRYDGALDVLNSMLKVEIKENEMSKKEILRTFFFNLIKNLISHRQIYYADKSLEMIKVKDEMYGELFMPFSKAI
ncbi:MAG: hypothetical protein CVT89_02155, partial [Candidatus Altiarchaeales archaeon HGW-Altiarchaeales-2]